MRYCHISTANLTFFDDIRLSDLYFKQSDMLQISGKVNLIFSSSIHSRSVNRPDDDVNEMSNVLADNAFRLH